MARGAGRRAREVLVLDRQVCLTLAELCHATGLHAEGVIALVELGVVEPSGHAPADWRFAGDALARVCTLTRLQQDLQLNPEGAALALELLDEVRTLRARVRALEALLGV